MESIRELIPPRKVTVTKKGKFCELSSEEDDNNVEFGESTNNANISHHSTSSGPGPSGAQSNLTPPAWFSAYEKRLDLRFTTLHECLSAEVNEVKEKCNQDIEDLRKKLESCMDKIDDLENRSRRSNLVFFNVPEGAEGNASCDAFMSSLLLKVDPNLKFSLQRAHRTPTGPRPQPTHENESPRPIHIAFGMYQEK